MQTLICIYSTKTGKEGMRISRSAAGSYSWIGHYGAGSGHSFEHMLRKVNAQKLKRRGMQLTAGVEFEKSREVQ